MYLNTTIKIPEIKGKIITKKKGTTTYILYQYGSEYRPEKQYSVPLRTIVGKISSSDSTLATVYKGNIIKNLIMDCQSYTKYRPNETTGGIFVSWWRKEELPTGA